MSDPMAEIRASFFIECEELLESLQDGLNLMDNGDSDSETINVVFRAVHSIKGGAGAFGLDDLVHFAHRFETAMDEVRAGRFVPDTEAIRVFFSCADLLGDLIRAARDGHVIPPEKTSPILDLLDKLVGCEEEEDEEELEFTPAALSFDLGDTAGLPDIPGLPSLEGVPDLAETDLDSDPKLVAAKGFDITFKPETALYTSGNEPLYLLRALRDLGDLEVECLTSQIPALDALDPDLGHLSWKLRIITEEPIESVREVFEFVDGLCTLDITPLATPVDFSAPDDDGPSIADLPNEFNTPTSPSEVPAPDNSAVSTTEPGEPNKEITKESPKQTTAKETPKPASNKASSAPTQPRATVRVDLERIDRLVNLVGELVINQAMLSQSVTEAGIAPNSPVSTGLEEFLQLTRDIQESVMMIRAQPIKSLFQRMGRIVRESSSSVGKEVRLHTAGENTEVDKTVIERLADPLTHMIRNAVDHGLETPEKREAAGKPREGRVTMTAQHRSGRILIEIADDGAGINRERVREKAIEKGLITAEMQLNDADIDGLLFMPGFSTASEISNLSGRGVGMDVVKSSIQSLGGRITITSVEGEGTTFSISLPLTLAVLDGMVVRVGGETLVVPLNAILETLTLTDDDLKALGPETHVVQIRGGFIPLLDLGAELGYRPPQDSYVGGIVLLIGQEDGNRAALAVDAIEDQRQVVIKGLEGSYGRVPGIAAATILGDGQIALILDPTDLVSQASGKTKKRNLPVQLAG
ncbi:chemotaxis protein CheA [Pacificibacter marinus]|uniref:Chemotaxis protein CheA n=1 Tax=Pacificibacter marinus TaxID=658057 RepID=A0A1Y5SV07_9RHOB|nr:chemotaxis protein CheA [Pacificibacter marinus]SEK84192.1 two-component system, chemotaxis family, sensor kinase CheA [Pacificibacter marinus]SLN48940.1 Chemotaxis protein CheA [Pacificibacter marinus]